MIQKFFILHFIDQKNSEFYKKEPADYFHQQALLLTMFKSK